jgi:hypothetical protein
VVLALVFIFLCVGLMAIFFVALRFSQISFLVVSILLFISRGVLVEFLRVQMLLYFRNL